MEGRLAVIRWPTRRLKLSRISQKRLRRAFAVMALCFPMAILVERVAWAPLPDARGAQAERRAHQVLTSAFAIEICSRRKESVLRCLCSLRARAIME